MNICRYIGVNKQLVTSEDFGLPRKLMNLPKHYLVLQPTMSQLKKMPEIIVIWFLII